MIVGDGHRRHAVAALGRSLPCQPPVVKSRPRCLRASCITTPRALAAEEFRFALSGRLACSPRALAGSVGRRPSPPVPTGPSLVEVLHRDELGRRTGNNDGALELALVLGQFLRVGSPENDDVGLDLAGGSRRPAPRRDGEGSPLSGSRRRSEPARAPSLPEQATAPGGHCSGR